MKAFLPKISYCLLIFFYIISTDALAQVVSPIPTISADKQVVKIDTSSSEIDTFPQIYKGEIFDLQGTTEAMAKVSLNIVPGGYKFNSQADDQGNWKLTIDTNPMSIGQYQLQLQIASIKSINVANKNIDFLLIEYQKTEERPSLWQQIINLAPSSKMLLAGTGSIIVVTLLVLIMRYFRD